MQQNNIDNIPDQQIRQVHQLRDLLVKGRCEVAPETPDGLMAKMVAMAGFKVAFVGMMGTTLNRIGMPDAGLLTATELVDNAGRCVAAAGLATVVDAGSGFGNPINVLRTVTELQRIGAQGVLLRDAQDPRTHRTDTGAISIADMASKLKAACDVRADSAWVLIAGIEGVSETSSLDEIISRASRYRDAGADLIYLGTLRSHAHVHALAKALDGLPLACSLTVDSQIDVGQLGPLGFQLALFPHCGLMAAIPAIEHTFAELARTGTVGHLRPHIANFQAFTDIAGLAQVQQLEQRYGVPEEQRTTL